MQIKYQLQTTLTKSRKNPYLSRGCKCKQPVTLKAELLQFKTHSDQRRQRAKEKGKSICGKG